MIEIFQPTLQDTSKEDIEKIVAIVQNTPELGFVFKALIEDHIKGNTQRANLLYARFDGEIAGVAIIGSRRPYAHHFRTGEIAVAKPFRRKRIATSLYFATTCAGILEGRRSVEETVILDLSPWMVRPTEAKGDCCGGEGFLISLNYHYAGSFPEHTSGFKTIEPWIKPTITEFDDWYKRIPEGTLVHLIDTPLGAINFEKCLKNYEQHRPELAAQLKAVRNRICFDLPEVEVSAE